MRSLLLLAASTLALTGIGLELASRAQTVDGLDLGRVRERARLSPEEAEALSRIIAKRGEALRDEAIATAATARANRPQPAANEAGAVGAFDFDAMVAASAPALATPDEAPRFIAFASLSMPKQSLKALIADMSRAGGAVVFRGFPHNSAKRFTTALGATLERDRPAGSVGIDPRLFRAFEIEAVPTYVVTTSDIALCDGFDCRTEVPPHDRMSGNVSVGYALERFAQGGGPGAHVAALHLDRLERQAP